MTASPALAETLTDHETAATKVDDVAKAALDRASGSGDRKSRDKKKSEPTEATREFWETWADNKTSAKPEPAPVAKAAEPDVVADAEEDVGEERKSRSRGGRGRGGKAKAEAKPAPKAAAAKAEKKEEAAAAPQAVGGRAKRDTVVTPAGDGTQARLFVSLGKKNGVSADDLRSLLAAPIGGDTARIGSVSLRDSHAHVRVPEELVDAIISGVHGKKHKDQDVTVERSRA
jgi:DbpA RNA binding domain